ncbi:MAG: 3-deoxy-manno-octulosonate cytidylyltransferase [Saprospiraceae bacterium]|nr:3-deoxy-manno-octulosonate cytidylyltransferase [Saprospiraceae bacterium]
MKYIGIIPARFASTRFPGKPLVNIQGKTMIQRVFEQASKAKILSKVVVATDNSQIFEHVRSFGGNVIMTSEHHRTGTERCFEVVEKLEESFDVAINIQGDEPFIDPKQIEKVAYCFKNKEIQIATLLKEISDSEELFNENVIKAVADKNKKAIYFSRNPIPYFRGKEKNTWLDNHKYFKHIGIYAYRTDVLEQIVKLSPTPLELAESLEQLRWIENGYNINVEFTEIESFSIDTPEDLAKAKLY